MAIEQKKNMMHYSSLTGEFYNSSLQAKLPADAVSITQEEFSKLMDLRAKGKIIVCNQSGYPIAVDPPGPTAKELWDAYRMDAQSLLNQSDITILRCAEHGIPIPPEWKEYRAKLRSIVSAPSEDPSLRIPKRPKYPEGT